MMTTTSPSPSAAAPEGRNERQLRQLAILHYLMAAVVLVLLYMRHVRDMGIAQNADPSGGYRWVLPLCAGVLHGVSGRAIQLRRWRWFSLLVAVVGLLQFPHMTVLGIFTLVTLRRGTVREEYARVKAEG